MQNNYKYIYFTENVSTTDFQVDLFSISNWFTQPDKYDSPFKNKKIYKYLRFKNNITTTEFQTDILPLSNWFSRPGEFPSPFINKPEDKEYFIESLSKNMELTKTNISNITGNEENFINNLNIIEKDGKININGYSLVNDNISIAFGSAVDDFIFKKINIVNNKQNNGFFNIDLDFRILRIGLYDYFVKDYFEDNNIIKVTTIVLYQRSIEENPNYNSKLVNLELIKDKKTNKITKKLWDAYGFNKNTSEIIPSNFSLIYYIFIKPIPYNNFRRLDVNNIFYLDGSYYKWELLKISATEYFKVQINEINNFIINEDKYFVNIGLYFISKTNFLLKGININEPYVTKVNNQNLIEAITERNYINYNKLYDDDFYDNQWYDLDKFTRENLEILGFNEEFWNLKKEDYYYNLSNINKDIMTSWNYISPEIKKAAMNLGYNSNSWDFKNSLIKRTFFCESDILIVNQNIFLRDILFVVPSNNYLVLGENCILTNRSVILNYGTLVIQDNGVLINEGRIINQKSGRIILTSANKNKTAGFYNGRVLMNLGTIYISGHSLFENNFTIQSNSVIKIGSLNNFKPAKSTAKLINNNLISTINQFGTNYVNKFNSNSIIQLENGSEIINNNIILVYKIYAINNIYKSKIVDNTKKVLSPNIPLNWEIEILINDITTQLPNYEQNNIYFGSKVLLKEIGSYINKPDLVASITENNNYMVFSIKNNSNIPSSGANNRDYFVLGFQTNYQNIVYKLDYILRNMNIDPKTIIVEDYNSQYSLFIDKEFCTITPALEAQDEFRFFIDKKKFIELAGFENKNVKAILLVDYGNYVGENNEYNNIVSYVFNNY